MTLLEELETTKGTTDPRHVSDSSSGVATVPPVGAEGQTGGAARLIARLEAEAYGTWQQAFAEVYGR